MRFVVACLACCVVLPATSAVRAATEIGSVVRVQGACAGTSEGVTRPLAAGLAVDLGETITTGKDARLEIGFNDGTVLTVGEDARLTLDEFVYRPAGESRIGLAVVGAFRFVSGKLATGATRQANVTTPFATIGVRGTDFWGGPIDGRYGVFLLEGAVTVTGGGGSASLEEPGASVDVDAIGGPPGPVTRWPRDKVDRAVATVTFR